LEQDGYFQIAVSLIPVRCFDAPLNAQLTREKALAYARVALGRHITGMPKGAIALRVRKVEVTDFRIDERRAALTARFPKDGLVVRQATSGEKLNALGAVEDGTNWPSARDLLEAKDDHLATLQSLMRFLMSEMPEVPKERRDADVFYQAVAEQEEIADRRLEQFRSAVGSDKLLLTIEREEILRAADVAKQEYLARLKRCVEQFDTTASED
jgi:hypothetical protein